MRFTKKHGRALLSALLSLLLCLSAAMPAFVPGAAPEAFAEVLDGETNKTHAFVFTLDGETLARVTLKAGETLFRPESPEAEGKVFAGWFADEACETPFIAFDENTAFEADDGETTVYAKMTDAAARVCVTYLDTQGSVVRTDVSAAGRTYSFRADSPAVTIHSLPQVNVGWRYGDGDEDYFADGDEITLTSDLTLRPVIRTAFTVTYAAQGGSQLTKRFVEPGEPTPVPEEDPTRTGYTFTGWYADAACTAAYDFTAGVTDNVTVYAGWSPAEVTYTVAFWKENSNYATEAEKYEYAGFFTRTARTGAEVTFTEASMTADEQNVVNTFKIRRSVSHSGWYWTVYVLENADTVTVDASGNTILNVYYRYKTFTIKFYHTNAANSQVANTNTALVSGVNNGTNGYHLVGSVTVRYGQTYENAGELPSEIWSWEWFSLFYVNGSNTPVYVSPRPITPETVVFSPAQLENWQQYLSNLAGRDLPDGSVLCVARYRNSDGPNHFELHIHEQTVNAAFKGLSGNEYKNDPTAYRLFSVTEYNYTYTTAENTLSSNDRRNAVASMTDVDGTLVSPGSNGRYQYSAGQTLHFWYDLKKYPIAFDTMGGPAPTLKETALLDDGDTVTLNYASVPCDAPMSFYWPDDYVIDETTYIRDGVKYVFKGWFDNAALAGDPATSDGIMPEHAMTYYAKWEAVQVTVTFDLNGGVFTDATPAVQSVDYGTEVQEPAPPVNGDKIFLGWLLGGNAYNFTSPVTKDITLVAFWADATFDPPTYTVSYSAGVGSGEVPADTNNYLANAGAVVAPGAALKGPNGEPFAAWRDGSGNCFYPGEVMPIGGANVLLTALYAASPVETSLTFDLNYEAIGFTAPEGAENTVLTVPNNTRVNVSDYAPTGAQTLPWCTFAGWYATPDCTGDALTDVLVDHQGDTPNTVYAKWMVETFNIRFVDWNGDLLEEAAWPYGSTPVYGGETPEKEADDDYSYAFTGWSPAIEPVTAAADYTAVYEAAPLEYEFDHFEWTEILNDENEIVAYERDVDVVLVNREYNKTRRVTVRNDLVTVLPECTEPGYLHYTVAYGVHTDDRLVVLDPINHDWGEPEAVWNGETVTVTVTCRNDPSHVMVLPADVTRTVITEPWCLTAGEVKLSASVVFNDVPYTFERTIILPALGHDWGEWEIVREATYTEPGLERRVCRRCGETEEREFRIQPEGHRKIQFTNMNGMHYVVELLDHERAVFHNSEALDWYENLPLTFRIVKYSTHEYDNYVIYANRQIISPNEDGSYTIPAGSEYTVITITGAKNEETPGSPADQTPGASAGKLSFMDALSAFFQKIANFFRNLFH